MINITVIIFITVINFILSKPALAADTPADTTQPQSQPQSPKTSPGDKFIGVNIHNLVNQDNERIEHILGYLGDSCGMNMVRIFFTSDQLSTDSLKKALDLGTKHNIKFIIALADYANRPNHLLPFGLEESPTGWYQDGYKQVYLPHVQRAVNAVKGHPAIYAWELANEPHCNGNNDCVAPYSAWVKDTSELIKSIDPIHIVSNGTMARRDIDLGDSPGNGQYESNNSLTSIGALSGHYYSDDLESEKQFMKQNIAIAKKLGKPFYIGEAGFLCGSSTNCTKASSENEQQRAQMVKKEIQDIFDAGATGYLLWQYSDRKNDWIENDPFSFFEGDPICKAITEEQSNPGSSFTLIGVKTTTTETKSFNCTDYPHECAAQKYAMATIPFKVEPEPENIFQSFINSILNIFGFKTYSTGTYAAEGETLFNSQLIKGVDSQSTDPVKKTGDRFGNDVRPAPKETNQNVLGETSDQKPSSAIGIYQKMLPKQVQEGLGTTCDFEKTYEKANFYNGVKPVTQGSCK